MRRVSFAVLLSFSSCLGVSGPGWERVVGLIEVGSTPPHALQAPDTVTAGAAFAVVVSTFGSSSCTRPDGAEVRGDRFVVEVTPYDRVAPSGTPCTGDLRAFPREVPLRFDAPGEAIVRVHGRGLDARPATVEARIQVRSSPSP